MIKTIKNQREILAVLPKKQKEMIQKVNTVIQFVGQIQKRVFFFRRTLLCNTQQKGKKNKLLSLWQQSKNPLRLLITNGNWYCFSWDLDKKFRDFHCDYIQYVKYKEKESSPFTKKTISSLLFKL